jgi:DNA repair exonuclease SbcCD nuclease subunit
MDYWALGHIHMPYQDSHINPRLVFSGCIQGRDIKETGPRGCYQVTLTEHASNQTEFIPLASVVWQRLDVDVSTCATLAEAHDAIMRALFAANGHAQCEEMIERVTLVGATSLHSVLRMPGVIEDLRAQINDGYPTFFCDALIDRTRAPLDRDALLEEGLFPAVLLRQAAAQEAEEASAVAYLQDEFLKKNLQLPRSCTRKIDTLQDDAETLLLDLLGGGAQ